jgi:hypothetical protein
MRVPLPRGGTKGSTYPAPESRLGPRRFCTPVVPARAARVTRMLPRLLDDPKRWLECAADMRSVAAEITDSDGRVIALRLAKDLEWFADWVSLRKNGPTTTRRS